MIYKFILLAIIGPPVALVIIFEIVLNASSIFNHGNIKISKSFDIALRKLIVTPNMHRIHHSAEEKETNSNYGFNLSVWDKLFGTYNKRPKKRDNIIIGLKELNNKNKSLFFLIFSPFKISKD
jgi:sterol desaturase/sphingolipid hydroxylase (fatty acid hydroxylase superfamily)